MENINYSVQYRTKFILAENVMASGERVHVFMVSDASSDIMIATGTCKPFCQDKRPY